MRYKEKKIYIYVERWEFKNSMNIPKYLTNFSEVM